MGAEHRFNGELIHFSKPVPNESSIHRLRCFCKDFCFGGAVGFLQISFEHFYLRLVFCFPRLSNCNRMRSNVWLKTEVPLRRLCEHYKVHGTQCHRQLLKFNGIFQNENRKPDSFFMRVIESNQSSAPFDSCCCFKYSRIISSYSSDLFNGK